jgi:hypothetical protein
MTKFMSTFSFILVFILQAAGGEATVGPGERESADDTETAHNSPPDRNRGDVQWITLDDKRLQICGLPWFKENAPLLWRLPERAADSMPPGVKRLMRFPTGARIRFASDTSSLRIRLDASSPVTLSNMSPIGSRGLDLYVDGTYWSSSTVTKEGEQVLTFFQGAPRKPKQITIYLPSFQEVSVSAVGVDEAAELSVPAPFAKALPMVFYGSSIAQGACAGRPGMSYEAIVARRLNLDFVNLGFSGSGKAEPEVVDLVASVDGCCYVFDLGKSYGTQPAVPYADMLRRIRTARPNAPLVCITPIFSTHELYDANYRELSGYVRDVVATAAGDMISAKDGNTHLVDGLELLGPSDTDAFQEGVHPNDLGFVRIADRIEPILRRILRLSDAAEAESREADAPN